MTQLSPSVYLRQQAARNGFPMGMLWLLSFALVTFSMEEPTLGILGNLCAFYTVFAGARMVRRQRAIMGRQGFLTWLWYAWLICFYATLITTFGQYLYFAFLDNGRFVQGFVRLMQDPLYKDSFQSLYPEGVNLDMMVEMASSLTIRDIVAQLLVTNLFCSVLVAVLSALFGSIGKVVSGGPKE